MRKFIELDKGESPYDYMKGKTVFIVTNKRGCSACGMLILKLEPVMNRYPNIDFVLCDINDSSITDYTDFVPPFFPYLKFYNMDVCVSADFTTKIELVIEHLDKLNNIW